MRIFVYTATVDVQLCYTICSFLHFECLVDFLLLPDEWQQEKIFCPLVDFAFNMLNAIIWSVQNNQSWHCLYFLSRVNIHPVLIHRLSIASSATFCLKSSWFFHTKSRFLKTSVQQHCHQQRHATFDTTLVCNKEQTVPGPGLFRHFCRANHTDRDH